jgi:hypothetical protein
VKYQDVANSSRDQGVTHITHPITHLIHATEIYRIDKRTSKNIFETDKEEMRKIRQQDGIKVVSQTDRSEQSITVLGTHELGVLNQLGYAPIGMCQSHKS